MKYLVTGGSGFIGSHLVEQLLKNGHSVINVDNFDDYYDYQIKIKNTLESLGKNTVFDFKEKEQDIRKLAADSASEQYRLYFQDIREVSGLREIFAGHQIDMVIHLAALAGVRPSIDRPLVYEEVNIRGSMNLWELCRDFKVGKFVCASSSSVYGNNEKVPFAETDSVDRPVSPYAATKRCGEIMGHVYHHLYDIDMIQLRFFTVYGPRQRPDLAVHKFSSMISQNAEIPLYGDGSTARDYTYIEDIIDGILKAVQYLEKHDSVYEIINLGENQSVTLDEMLALVEENLGKKAVRKELPLPPGDVRKTHADIRKATNLLGYQPVTAFQNGIKKFMEWFLRK